jgi:plasmid stabilization system protein ParE
MMLPVRLRPEALDELAEAWRWYEDQRQGLGDELRACVEAAVAEIARSPLAWAKVRGEARRHVVKRFPYAVIYLAEPCHVEVLGVFHCSRDPRRWQERAR